MTFKHKNAKHFQYFDYPIGLNKTHTNILTLLLILLMSKDAGELQNIIVTKVLCSDIKVAIYYDTLNYFILKNISHIV